MTDATIDDAGRSIRLRWSDGLVAELPYLWLRDNAAEAFHPDTGERMGDLMAVPPDTRPADTSLAGNALVVRWCDGESVVTRHDLDWLRDHRPGVPAPDPADIPPERWRAGLGAAGIPRAAAQALMGSNAALAAWMAATKRVGLSLVTGLADDPEAGLDVARRIGFLRATNFGTVFEVRSIPKPNNLAYTAHALPLHTDLPNQELPPGFQFLHCLANEAEGGGSVFADGFAIAEDLRRDDPEAFGLLASRSIPFRFHDADCDIRRRQTVLRLDDAGNVEEVCFNAHIADVLDLPAREIEPFYHAYRRFMALARDPAYHLELKLGAGEMVVFDNRRVLHGRAAFDPNTGLRHLRGAYVDRGEFDSRLRVLAR